MLSLSLPSDVRIDDGYFVALLHAKIRRMINNNGECATLHAAESSPIRPDYLQIGAA